MSKKKEHTKKAAVTLSSSAHVLTASDCGLTQLSEDQFVAPESFSLVVRGLLMNWRQGTVACKGRAQVSGSNKKPWKQKGTGKARAGARTSPLWRGGGIIFGPQKRTRTLSVTKKTRKGVFKSVLFDAFNRGTIVQLDWAAQGTSPKTKAAFEALKSINAHTASVNVFVDAHDVLTIASFANIPLVRLVLYDAANVYELADAAFWIVLKKDKELFQEMVARWN